MKTAVIWEDAAGIVTYNTFLVALLAHVQSRHLVDWVQDACFA